MRTSAATRSNHRRFFRVAVWLAVIIALAVMLVIWLGRRDELPLNNRQVASVFWITIALAWMVSLASLRQPIWNILKAAGNPKISVSFSLMTLWIVGLLLLAHRAGIWTLTIIGEPTAWFIGIAVGLFLNVPGHLSDKHFVRRTVISVLSLAVLVEVFMNLFVFSLPVELAIQPAIFILVMCSTIAALKQEYVPAKKLIDGLLAIIGLSIGSYVVYKLIGGWTEVNVSEEARRVITPIWLTVGILPFIYALSLYAAYDDMFTRVNYKAENHRGRLRSEFALVMYFRFQPHQASGFNLYWASRLAKTTSLREALDVIRQSQTSTQPPSDQR